jgi:hypothetical protein
MLDPIVQAALAETELMLAIPWPAIIAGLTGLGSSWLNYRGASSAAERQLEELRRSRESSERLTGAELLLQNRWREQQFERTLAAMGARYGTFRLPILNRWGTGWPSQDEYMQNLRGGYTPLSDEDLQHLVKHGSFPGQTGSQTSSQAPGGLRVHRRPRRTLAEMTGGG